MPKPEPYDTHTVNVYGVVPYMKDNRYAFALTIEKIGAPDLEDSDDHVFFVNEFVKLTGKIGYYTGTIEGHIAGIRYSAACKKMLVSIHVYNRSKKLFDDWQCVEVDTITNIEPAKR